MEEERKKELESADKLCILGESIMIPDILMAAGYTKMSQADIKFVKDKKNIITWSQNYANLD